MAKGLLFASFDFSTAHEDEFHDWYDLEHIPERLRVPSPGRDGVSDMELFASIYTPGKLLLLVSWRDAAAADAWQPPASLADAGRIRHRRVRVVRDYGLADRREAPQFYPDVARRGDVG